MTGRYDVPPNLVVIDIDAISDDILWLIDTKYSAVLNSSDLFELAGIARDREQRRADRLAAVLAGDDARAVAS